MAAVQSTITTTRPSMRTPPVSTGLVLAALAAGTALALPFWVGRVVPLLDLPQHLALVAVLRHHGDPAWGFERFFDVEWATLTPYWTYYAAATALSWLMPVETATRLYLTAGALAWPWAGIALCRARGSSPWLGLLVAPLALDTNLYLGFVSYTSGVLLLFFLSALFLRYLERATWPSGVATALGAGLLFFTHVQPFVFFLALSAWFAATARALRWPGRLGRLLPLLPATLGLFVPWIYAQFIAGRQGSGARYTFGRIGSLRALFRSPLESLTDLPSSIAGAFQDRSDLVLLAGWAALVAWAVPASRVRMRLVVPVLLALLGYFAAPMSIAGQWNIGPRFATLAALLLVAVLDVDLPLARRIGAAAAALAVLVGVNAAREHIHFDREAGAFDRALEAIPRGSRVLPLIFENRGQVIATWPYLHIGQYAMVRGGGVVSSTLARVPAFPIRLRDPKSLPALDPFQPRWFRYETAGLAYDVFLLRGAGAVERAAFPPGSVDVVFDEGDWTVLRRR
jgi:hypothetical protein